MILNMSNKKLKLKTFRRYIFLRRFEKTTTKEVEG